MGLDYYLRDHRRFHHRFAATTLESLCRTIRRMRSHTTSNRSVLLALLVAIALALGACSQDGSSDASGSKGTSGSTRTTNATRPKGLAAKLTGPLTAGKGVFVGSPAPYEPAPGYVEEEYTAAGTATSYRSPEPLTGNGEWSLESGTAADYRTRIVVRRPKRASDASGVVVLEWLNVSGGVDADPEFNTLREEIERQGHVWVGVSAQALGIEGGPVLVRVNVPGAGDAGRGLKAIDPARYGSLKHPGDAYANDIFTQVARVVREGSVAPNLDVSHVIASGESQSAFALVTYINGVQPLTEIFDGFFVHSRGASAFPLPVAGESADISRSIGGTPTIFRADSKVPVLDLQAENDVVGVLGSVAARQPDNDMFRLWEVAGTAHADRHLMGGTTADAIDCGVPINDGPLHIVAKAAFRHLVAWVADGVAPPTAPRLALVEGAAPVISRDDDGIAHGGIRTPSVDVPAQVLSGVQGPSGQIICMLSGSTNPMVAERLAELYPTRKAYMKAYNKVVDAAIDAGFALEADRKALEGYARPQLLKG